MSVEALAVIVEAKHAKEKQEKITSKCSSSCRSSKTEKIIRNWWCYLNSLAVAVAVTSSQSQADGTVPTPPSLPPVSPVSEESGDDTEPDDTEPESSDNEEPEPDVRRRFLSMVTLDNDEKKSKILSGDICVEWLVYGAQLLSYITGHCTHKLLGSVHRERTHTQSQSSVHQGQPCILCESCLISLPRV